MNEVKEIVKEAMGTQERAPTTKCDVNEVKEIVKQALGTQERAPTTHKQPASTMQDRSVLDDTVKEM